MPRTARIMIVDDTRFVRLVLKELLETQGPYQIVAEAVNGEHAISSYFKYRPDLVLMDLIMPKLTGLDAISAIIQGDPKAQIIILSGIDNREGISRALSMGAVDFLTKPIDKETLLQTLAHHISKEELISEVDSRDREFIVRLVFSFFSELLRHSISPLDKHVGRVLSELLADFSCQHSRDYRVFHDVPAAIPRPNLSYEQIVTDLRDLITNLQERLTAVLTHDLVAGLLQETYQTFLAKFKSYPQINQAEALFPKTLWLMGAIKKLNLIGDGKQLIPMSNHIDFKQKMVWLIVYKLSPMGVDVVSAQEGDIEINNKIGMFEWHIKAGFVFLNALGQGDEYHEGLFGPFPVPASKEHSALVFAIKTLDKESTDPRMTGQAYVILGLFYRKSVENLLPTREKLNLTFNNSINPMNDVSQIDGDTLDSIKEKILNIRNNNHI